MACGKAVMKLKILKNTAIALFCAAAAAGNLLWFTRTQPVQSENIVFYDVPAVSQDNTAAAIDINTAGVEELMLLPGIGEVRARAIIEYRELYGGFVSKEEITEVRGIGSSTYENIKDLITITKDP